MTNTTSDGDDLLDKHQIAAMFGVCEQVIGIWVKRGKFPPGLRITQKVTRWRRDVVLAAIRGEWKPETKTNTEE